MTDFTASAKPETEEQEPSWKTEEKEPSWSRYKLVPRITISHNSAEVFSVRFDPEGKYIAAGCGDGALRVFNSHTGGLAYNLQGGSNATLPTTSVRFRPPENESSKSKHILLAANTAGILQHWHTMSGKCVHSMEEAEGNQVYALDYFDYGGQFVTAGKDTALRIYDEATKSLVTTMQGGVRHGTKDPAGHSNRIFSVKVNPHDQDMILSGGWDNTVQIWDTRKGGAVSSIFGPHLCGDALDIHDYTLLTGSCRDSTQLEMWDIRTCTRICEIPYVTAKPCKLYAAQFSKDPAGRFIAAGGSGANEAKVFDRSRGDNSVVGTITGLSRGVFTVDFSPDQTKLAIAGGDSTIRIFDLVSRDGDDGAK
ncbi:WD40-repeat-containing domain protein [Ochromonadaceae sp. CCMP2298]|nr:WD40-repeat-containing domain protein [Ochromonadaceae sp. CCMP2298]